MITIETSIVRKQRVRFRSMIRAFGLDRLRRHRQATAALEFAMLAPIVTSFMAAGADFGLAMWSRSCLTNAVAQGGYYAFLHSTTATSTSIQSVVQNATPLSNVSATVSSPTACYCPSGTPAVLGTAVSCTSTCSDSTSPGTYVKITATYTLQSYMANISLLGGTQITDQTVVRLK